MENNLIGEIASVLTALIWAVTAFFFASVTLKVGSATVNLTRLLISTILLIFTILLFNIQIHISNYQIEMLFLSGVSGLVGGDIFFFKSLEYVSARITTLVASFVPAITAVLGFIFIGEGLSLLNILGIAITLSGIWLVILKHEDQNVKIYPSKGKTKGVIFAFLYTFGQGVGLILAKAAYQEGEINSIVATLFRFVPGVIVLIPFLILMGEYKNPVKIFRTDMKSFKLLLGTTILSAYLGTVLMFIAITHTAVAVSSTIIATVPVVQLPIAKYFYKERLTWHAITGALLTVAGLIVLLSG